MVLGALEVIAKNTESQDLTSYLPNRDSVGEAGAKNGIRM